MSYSTRPRFNSSVYSVFPSGVKWLLISNIALFVLYYFSVLTGTGDLFYPFGLVPRDVLRGSLWQLVTYMFLHDPLGFGHILFNMLALWMFGADLERTWGTRRFMKFYFICGVGAGVCVVLANLLFSQSLISRTIGSSGAIYGLLLAFGMLFPDREVLFSFLFPIKAKYFVMIIGAIAFLSSFNASGGGISHVAHLGGMVCGYIYLRTQKKRSGPRFNLSNTLSRWYQEFKMQRAKRKFQLYLRKRDHDQRGDRDRWVN